MQNIFKNKILNSVIIVVVLVGGFFFYIHYSANKTAKELLQKEVVKKPKVDFASIEGLRVYEDKVCNINFKLPPDEVKDGKVVSLWVVPADSSNPNILALLYPRNEIKQVDIKFMREVPLTGMTEEKRIAVSCVANPEGLNNQKFLERLQKRMLEYNVENLRNPQNVPGVPSSYGISNSQGVQSMGRSPLGVNVAQFYKNGLGEIQNSEVFYYVYAGPTRIYVVYIQGVAGGSTSDLATEILTNAAIVD